MNLKLFWIELVFMYLQFIFQHLVLNAQIVGLKNFLVKALEDKLCLRDGLEELIFEFLAL